MKKIIIGVVSLLVLTFWKELPGLYSFRPLFSLGQFASVIYLAVVFFRYVKNTPLKPVAPVSAQRPVNIVDAPQTQSSGRLWLVYILVGVVVIFLLNVVLGKISFEAFYFLDNLVKFSYSMPPAMAWAITGLLVGAVYGSFVAWRKYRLPVGVNLIPVGAVLLIISMLFLLNDPMSDSSVGVVSEPVPAVSSNATPTQMFQKKWEMTEVVKKSKKSFFQREKVNSLGLEFKSNGKCYTYENGVTVAISTYVMADDEKSFSLKTANKPAVQITIVSISPDELVLSFPTSGKETATFKAVSE